jgi:hypothetical protein
MRRYVFAILLTTLFGLATGAGFALVDDPSPKYYPLDLIEYEKCLESSSNLYLSLAESNKNVKYAEYKGSIAYCQPYRPTPIK